MNARRKDAGRSDARRKDAARHPVVRLTGVLVAAAVALMCVVGVLMCAIGEWMWRTALYGFAQVSARAYLLYLFIKTYYDVEELKERLKDYENKD